MINTCKKIINQFPLLKRFILPIYLGAGSAIFWVYKKYNSTFSYVLIDKTKVKFYTNGQIAKGIFWGEFERKELEVFQLLLEPGSVVIDAGANIGLYSIIGSKRVGATGKVFSFEPSKANFKLFLKNIELNQIKNIIPVNMGLGDEIADKLILSQNPENGDGEKYILKDENLIKNNLNNNKSNEIIALDTLDNFQLNNNITKVDFLKIDVEGYEYYVLKGAEKLLKNNPEIIILFECAEHLAKRARSTQNAVFTLLNDLNIEIVYWDEKEKKWGTDLIKAKKSGQLLGGRNIMSTINNLSLNKLNINFK